MPFSRLNLGIQIACQYVFVLKYLFIYNSLLISLIAFISKPLYRHLPLFITLFKKLLKLTTVLIDNPRY